MAWMTVAVEAGYQLIDQQVLAVGNGAEAPLPQPGAAMVGQPGTLPVVEKIFVQSLSTNTASIFVGYTGVHTDGSTGGYELPPGASMTLPHHLWQKWVARAGAAGQKLLVTYLKSVA